MKALKIFFSLVFVAILGATLWASEEKSVWFGYQYLFGERWGLATLTDAYCAFLTFYAWLFYREPRWIARLLWLALILFFGNIAMSIYALIELHRYKGSSVEEFILGKKALRRESKVS